MLSESIDLLHTPRNAPVPYPTMHQFLTEMCKIVNCGFFLWRTVGFVRSIDS